MQDVEKYKKLAKNFCTEKNLGNKSNKYYFET